MNNSPLKIAIGVHGRFHAFGLAAGLLALGHDVTVFTNYPATVAARFGLPAERVRGFVLHGVVVRLVARLKLGQIFPALDAWLHGWFGSWLARRLTAQRWDATYTWSSVSEEYLKRPRVSEARLMARGSTHIRSQWRVLHDEELRAGCEIEKPAEAIMRREECEYGLADAVVVLSSFSRQSFLEAGHSPERVRLMVSAVHTADFAVTPVALEARRRRLTSGEPLRILNVGTLSFRKGALDLAAVVRALPADRFQIRFVGTVAPEAAPLAEAVGIRIEWVARVPQNELKEHYEWADVFVLPSIEEGLAAVLPQAAAAGLLVLATPNSGAEDVIRDGQSGWILPARDASAFVQKLTWIDQHRIEAAAMLDDAERRANSRDWRDAAEDFAGICRDIRQKRNL
jgi:glycosyltransferase involved in cell wall biosynthesis